MQQAPYNIIVFLIITTFLILLMAAFIITIFFLYRRKQTWFQQNIEQLKLDYEKNLLSTQLEIQEQTLRHISREIHDNITLNISLAKLYLNTLELDDRVQTETKVQSSVDILGKSIEQLSNISKGMNTDIIIQQGLLKAVEEELNNIRQTGLFQVEYVLTGNPVYMDAQNELIIFRIVQEAFNNIIKHAAADKARLSLHYNERNLHIRISDDGNGFDKELNHAPHHAGLKNMETRIKMLKGAMDMQSSPGKGTNLTFTIPFE